MQTRVTPHAPPRYVARDHGYPLPKRIPTHVHTNVSTPPLIVPDPARLSMTPLVPCAMHVPAQSDLERREERERLDAHVRTPISHTGDSPGGGSCIIPVHRHMIPKRTSASPPAARASASPNLTPRRTQTLPTRCIIPVLIGTDIEPSNPSSPRTPQPTPMHHPMPHLSVPPPPPPR
ncbi:hypothetical protein DFH06DRAFT_1225345 [Mycena polygramma]|nr:hypothetical protein DFH06DRAFT_1225345 [Mycena polygramma]